ncbi:MAG TPA: hypothetical protein VG602_06260 [Actinomycetota bacterium]|nr:hypothetical protein [Actinomycetota bacterium]
MTVDYQMAQHFVIPLVGFLLGAFLGSAWLLPLPVLYWTVFFLGLEEGQWGYGYQDGWMFALVLWSFVSVASVALGLLVRWLVRWRRRARLGAGPI